MHQRLVAAGDDGNATPGSGSGHLQGVGTPRPPARHDDSDLRQAENADLLRVATFRRALTELGDVSAEERAAFMQKNHGVTVRPQFVPVLKATLKDKENLAERRRKSAAAAKASNPAPADGRPEAA